MKAAKNIKKQYEENPTKVKAWGAIVGCLAFMIGVVAAGIKQDIEDAKEE